MREPPTTKFDSGHEIKVRLGSIRVTLAVLLENSLRYLAAVAPPCPPPITRISAFCKSARAWPEIPAYKPRAAALFPMKCRRSIMRSFIVFYQVDWRWFQVAHQNSLWQAGA